MGNLTTFRRFAGRRSAWLDRWGLELAAQVDAQADPATVPLRALKRMDTDPIVYLGEWAIAGLVRQPELYHVTHPLGDRRLVAETEEWLWPLLPELTAFAARAFFYGALPYVLDWAREDLVVRVPGPAGRPWRRTLRGHLHYVDAHDLFPGDVELVVDGRDRLVAIRYEGRLYGEDVGRVAVWDRQFGEWVGRGARRRAWSYWAKARIFELLQARYLERTVHTPLVVYAPGDDAKEEEGDEEKPVGEFIQEQLAELRGGGYMSLPADRDGEGGPRLYELEPLELPERSEVFDRALNRFDAAKLAAYLVPPAMPLLEEAGGASARVLKDLFAIFVEALLAFAAGELSAIVATVHARNHDPATTPAPEVGTNKIPDKIQKLYLEVLRTVSTSAWLGERVDPDALLDQLGVPRRVTEEPETGTEEGGTPEAEAGAAPDFAEVEAAMNAYGIGVRSGVLTPHRTDENYFRQAMGLPEAGDEVLGAWDEEPVRRPVTIAQTGAAAPSGGLPPAERAVPSFPSSPAPPEEPPPRPPGRPRDATSAREERREDARTETGAEDTGGEGVERDERG